LYLIKFNSLVTKRYLHAWYKNNDKMVIISSFPKAKYCQITNEQRNQFILVIVTSKLLTFKELIYQHIITLSLFQQEYKINYTKLCYMYIYNIHTINFKTMHNL
jgi:hypothetical protein